MCIVLLQLETRVYGAEKGYHGIQLMPLVDFADHSNASPHHYHNVPCSSNPEGSADDASAKVCLLAYAGAPIQPWEEILMKYRWDGRDGRDKWIHMSAIYAFHVYFMVNPYVSHLPHMATTCPSCRVYVWELSHMYP